MPPLDWTLTFYLLAYGQISCGADLEVPGEGASQARLVGVGSHGRLGTVAIHQEVQRDFSILTTSMGKTTSSGNRPRLKS